MSKLITGIIIEFNDGTEGKVIKELGSGGQGTVYLIERQGKQYALKWYHDCPHDDMIDNMKENIRCGSPSFEFLWPLTDTPKVNGSYGYLMNLRPDTFYDFTNFIIGGPNSIECTNEEAQINAAINICSAFQKLHIKGLSYQDLNDGNFFIDPNNGDVLIADNDNAAPDKSNISGIKGKCRYMAPEVVLGNTPDKYSDFFSLAVVLFKFFFFDHPLEGKYYQSCPCLDEKAERLFYGDKPIFIFDKTDKTNTATDINKNAIKRWPKASRILKEAFLKAFSYEAMHNPTKRLTERDWVKALVAYRASLLRCPICGKLTYIEKEDHGICQECNNKRGIFWMAIGNERIPLLEGQKLYSAQTEGNIDYKKVTAKVIRSRKNITALGIGNASKIDWTYSVRHPKTGQLITKTIKLGEVAPLHDGCKIGFGNQIEGVVKYIEH